MPADNEVEYCEMCDLDDIETVAVETREFGGCVSVDHWLCGKHAAEFDRMESDLFGEEN